MTSQRKQPWLLAALLGLLLALPAAAPAAGDSQRRHAQDGEPTPTKPRLGESKSTSPSHVAQEGGSQRPLWLDNSRVVEFPKSGVAAQPSIRAAAPGETTRGSHSGKPDAKDTAADAAAASSDAAASSSGAADASTATDAAEISPVFVDASGQPRALPGGVIISLKEELPDNQAQAQLQAQGLTPVRRIGARMWLVQSPVGIASLELANRLQASGRYDFVQPNWWQPRTTK